MDKSASQDHLVKKLVANLEIPTKIAQKAASQSLNESEAIELAHTLLQHEKVVDRLMAEFPILSRKDRRLVEFLVEQNNGNYSHSLWALKRTFLAKRFEKKHSNAETKKSNNL
ncbi:MAG: hypothetical protein ACE5R6_08185 [Candidatus Heimdallarchaeota archaeon]